MHLLIVGTIVLFCLIIVESKEYRGPQEGGRFFKLGLLKRINDAKLRMARLKRSIGMGILSSFNIDEGVRGISCRRDRCTHYGDETRHKQGTAKWSAMIGSMRYLCYEKYAEDCPQFEGGRYRRFKGKVPKKELNYYQMVVCGKVYLCEAHSPKKCPRVPILETQWEMVTKEKIYITEQGSIIIMCIASDIERCYKKFGNNSWQEKVDLGDYTEISWYYVDEGIKYYCKASKKEDCPDIDGIVVQWRKYCGDKEVEECGKSEWELMVEGYVIICVAYDVDDCKKTKNGHWKPSTRGQNKSGKPKKTYWVIEGFGGSKFYCEAADGVKCSDDFTASGARKWLEAPPDDPSDFEDELWELKIQGKSIICSTSDVKYCKKVHKGKWKLSNWGTDDHGFPDNARWEISTGKAKLYCDAKSAKKCPKIKKGKWGEAGVAHDKSKDEPEDKPENESEDEHETNQWMLRVKGKLIICVADNVDYCKEFHKGHWKTRQKKSNENSKWWVPKDKSRVYCDEKSYKKCPKLQERIHWERNPGHPNSDALMWHLSVNGERLICVAYEVKDCKKMHGGHWKRCEVGERNNHGVPDNSKWWLIVRKARAYCNSKSSKLCPKLNTKGGGRWQEISESSNDDEPDQWELNVNGETLICVADDVDDCKKIHDGHWKRSKDRKKDANGAPEGSKWWIILGKARVYCNSKSLKSCPELSAKGGGRWQEVPEDSNDDEPDQWELNVNGETLICVADDVDDCKKIHKGHWKRTKGHKTGVNGVPEGAKWWKIVGKARVYCKSKSLKSCPALSKGGKWKKVQGSSDYGPTKKRVPTDKRYVDAGKIAPAVVGGGRYKQSKNGDTILLCYADYPNDCPEGPKWMRTKNEVGKKICNIVTGKNIWVLVIKDVHIVCIAEDLSFCKPKRNDGWIIIAGMKSGLWKTTYKGVLVYCEAEEETYCPQEFGDWNLVSMDQWIQKTLDLNKKGEMWRMVSFRFTVLCTAKYKGKCPKFKKYSWHKIFGDNIDYKAYGKEVKFKSQIESALYYCKAESEDACPELPYDESWEKVDRKVTLEELLIFFEDIVGFEDNCRSGICKLPNEIKGDPFD